jgi:hypothetical protein
MSTEDAGPLEPEDIPRPVRERRAARELHGLFEAANARYQGWDCARSGDCCQVTKTGREPYVWPVEWAAVQEGLRQQGRRLPLAPRADGACPLLDQKGRCSLYAHRPLGCRTFYCERGTGPRVTRDDVTGLMQRLERVSQARDPDVDQPAALKGLLLGG